MRISQNPNKNSGVTVPDVTLSMVTHLTDHPYHASRMEVVQKSIESMLEGADGHYCELLIWDNGSNDELRDYLRGLDCMLVLSPNIGKTSAVANLCAMARGSIFCYSDDDILFEQDWLKKQLEILDTYPNVGLVSGSPIRAHFRWGCKTVAQFSEWPTVTVTRGKLIPDELGRDYCASVGREFSEYQQATADLEDVLLEYEGVKAWGHGHHMQYTARRDTLLPFLKHDALCLADEKPFDIAVDNSGLLRLTTYERTCRHMGNVLS